MRLSLNPNIRQLIGVVGRQCSGKTFVADHIAKSCGYQVIHIGEYIRSRIHMNKITSGYIAAPSNLDFMVEQFLSSKLSHTAFQSVILESFPKNLEQVKTFVKIARHFNIAVKVYHITAEDVVRRHRFVKRNGGTDAKSESYWNRREKEEKNGIKRIIKYLIKSGVDIIEISNSAKGATWNISE